MYFDEREAHMKELVNFWEDSYYTEFILAIIQVVTLYFVIKHQKRIPELKLLPIYLFAFVTLQFLSYAELLIFGKPDFTLFNQVIWALHYVVSILEISCFAYFFWSLLTTRWMKQSTRAIAGCIVCSLVLGYFISLGFPVNYRHKILNELYIFHSLGLVLPCVFYFYELFNNSFHERLLDLPHFWAASGIAFYSLCTLPITLITPHLVTHDATLFRNLFAAIYVFYMILFILLIRAYLCKKLDPKY